MSALRNLSWVLFVVFLSLLMFAPVKQQSTLEVPTRPAVTPTTMATPLYPNRALDLDLLPVFEELMTAELDCILPCWWGFQPGETTVNEIIKFLQETGFDRDWYESGLSLTLEEYLRAGEPFGLDFLDTQVRQIYTFSISFVVERNQLNSMLLTFSAPDEWLLREANRIGFPFVLAQLETLPMIFITGLSTDLNLAMHVIYKDSGIWFAYRFNLLGNPPSEEPSLCFSIEQTRSIRLRLSTPGDEGFIREYEGLRDDTQLTLYSFEDLYNIDTKTLKAFFVSNPEGCLDDLVSG